MKELRLHQRLYRAAAIDEALGVYGSFATIVRADEPPYCVLTVSSDDALREREVAGELANYALGASVKRRREDDARDEG